MKFSFGACGLILIHVGLNAENEIMKQKGGPLSPFIFNNLAAFSNLVHFVSTRAGGVSQAPYNSLNLGLHTWDSEEHVLANRMLLANAVGIEPQLFLYASQIHSGDVLVIDTETFATIQHSEPPKTDAMITNVPGICLMVMVADCVPVVLFDPNKKVSAVIHAGWRGTVKNITSHTIQTMRKAFGCNPADIMAGIGPSIGPCCYEVGDDVEQLVKQNFGTTKGFMVTHTDKAKPHFDLWNANFKQLVDDGVKAYNIETAELCTRCNPEIFYSSRASDGITGRFAAGICMLPTEN